LDPGSTKTRPPIPARRSGTGAAVRSAIWSTTAGVYELFRHAAGPV